MSDSDNQKQWGWDAAWEKAKKKLIQPGQEVGRVTAVYREKCLLRFSDKEQLAEVTGKFRHTARTAADYPAVGDWVLGERAGDDLALIHCLLPRRTYLSRKQAGPVQQEQVLATNVDVVFVTTAFDHDFNPRRIERYAVTTRQARMEPIVLINKCDLAQPNDPRIQQARDANPSGMILPVSAKTGEGLETVTFYLEEGKTGIFLGSSGVGKSTILNALLGRNVQKTESVRLSDSRGRHTTTTRQMFQLPDGGLIIDTPGLREIQLWAEESALPDVFTDIAQLARSCRYNDCQHKSEPGCAVKEALEKGTLSEGRYKGYVKLQKELAYLKRKQDPQQQANTKRRWKTIQKQMEGYIKKKRNPDA